MFQKVQLIHTRLINLIYPVKDRSEATLIPLIQRHGQPGSSIYSDGWSAYCDLNNKGVGISQYYTNIHLKRFIVRGLSCEPNMYVS